MRHDAVPPVATCDRPVDRRVVTGDPLPRAIHSALLISQGADGTVAVSVLRT
jgi:hypothetical protein